MSGNPEHGQFPYDHMPLTGHPDLSKAGDPPGTRLCYLCKKDIGRSRGVRVLGSGYAHLSCWQSDQSDKSKTDERA